MLEEIGFRFQRRGKGDHTIYMRGDQQESVAGSPNHEVPKKRWERLRKKYDLKG
jgi:hypothetical protein